MTIKVSCLSGCLTISSKDKEKDKDKLKMKIKHSGTQNIRQRKVEFPKGIYQIQKCNKNTQLRQRKRFLLQNLQFQSTSGYFVTNYATTGQEHHVTPNCRTRDIKFFGENCDPLKNYHVELFKGENRIILRHT